jgi:replicative DNA helicase
MGNMTKVQDIIIPVFDEIVKSSYLGLPNSTIKTGIKALDNVTLGFNSSDLITIAGSTYSYQGLFTVNIATNLFLQNKPILFFEMGNRNIWRIYSSILGCTFDNPFKINHDNFDFRKQAKNDIEQIIDEIELFAERNPKGVVFIDSYQAIDHKKDFCNNEALWNISSRLKNLAKKLAMPIILVVDISARSPRYRYNSTNMGALFLHDELNEDSDKIMLTYSLESETNINDEYQKFYVNVAKNRNGMTGSIELFTDISTCKITEMQYKHKNFSEAI